jgi:hypothetical protein
MMEEVVPAKRWFLQETPGVISKKKAFFTVIDRETSNLTKRIKF